MRELDSEIVKDNVEKVIIIEPNSKLWAFFTAARIMARDEGKLYLSQEIKYIKVL